MSEAIKIALDSLKEPRQLDSDGVRVEVSNEALDVVITYVESLKEQEPVAYLKFWAGRMMSPDGGVETDEGLEVCRKGEIGADKLPAFPVYTAPAPDVRDKRIASLEAELKALKEREVVAYRGQRSYSGNERPSWFYSDNLENCMELQGRRGLKANPDFLNWEALCRCAVSEANQPRATCYTTHERTHERKSSDRKC
jgi:hypothetical protein